MATSAYQPKRIALIPPTDDEPRGSAADENGEGLQGGLEEGTASLPPLTVLWPAGGWLQLTLDAGDLDGVDDDA